MCHPDPRQIFPISGKRQLCLLKNAVTNPNIIVGDYTYYEDPDDIRNFQRHVLYHSDSPKNRLIIGKFCQIASEVKFLMNGMNISKRAFSTFPFGLLDNELNCYSDQSHTMHDTIIGNDVSIGYSVVFMPGVEVGDGAVIKPYSVVTQDVLPYSIVEGNPAHCTEYRFDPATIEYLLRIKWWNWPIHEIVKNAQAIAQGNMLKLQSKLTNEIG